MPISMWGRRSRVVLRAMLFSALVGCGDSSGPRPIALCDEAVTVTGTPGSSPEFTWSPACRVEVLGVEKLSDGTTTWFVLADPFTGRAIVQPARYGVVPADALELTFWLDQDLQPGTRDEVTLTISESPGGDVVVGRAEFVP
jgi:hypothetical protein